ncbi:MAG TPA: sugar nucleotide-binding protein [Solirubrobacteraceae bacterium]|nr:sugar nucleotide-binding protein [Solirubrobacteraceae bacterium]
MRILVTGASGLIGSNLAAAATQQSWSVLGTWRDRRVRIPGARTMRLDMANRRACVDAAMSFEPDVIVHAAAGGTPSRLEREPFLAQLDQLGVMHTLLAAESVRARYVLVSCDWVFSGYRPPSQRWSEDDLLGPVNAYGCCKQLAEQAVMESNVPWLITRPANVYGVNLSRPEEPGELAHHVWEHSGEALRWARRLRDGHILPAPEDVYQSPTFAWDYAQRACELIAQERDGVFHTAGPDSINRQDYLQLLADAFDCDPELVRDGNVARFLEVCGENPRMKLPSNVALKDEKAVAVLGHPAVDAHAGHRLMRDQLRRALAHADSYA